MPGVPPVPPAWPSVVDCAVYRDGARLPGCATPAEAVAEVRAGGGFAWIGLLEPDDREVRDVLAALGSPERCAADALRGHRRPKLVHHDATLTLVLKTVRHVRNESPTTANEVVETGEVLAVLGADFLVTVRRGEHSDLRDLRARLEATPGRLTDPATVVHAITDRVVREHAAVTEACEADVDVLAELVFSPRSPVLVEHVYLMRREILELRRAVVSLAAPLRRLAHTPQVPEEVRSRFRSVEERLSEVSDRIARVDALLTTLVDAAVALLTLRQNDDMRTMGAWAAIIAVPTLVFGVYGMNFDAMPELHWRYGYPLLLTLVLAACLVLHRVFTRNRWL